jgi:hypothetical protein
LLPEPLKPPILTGTATPELNDIMTEFHPSCQHSPTIEPMDKYGFKKPSLSVPELKPWEPFQTRLDFEVSKLALEAMLNQSQIKCLVNLIHQAVEKETKDDVFTIKSASEMKELWKLASGKCTGVIPNHFDFVRRLIKLSVPENGNLGPIQESRTEIWISIL